jgi:hypothetical protein
MLARRGQVASLIFTTGRPSPAASPGAVGDAGDQLEVDALVDHAVEAEARTGDRGLVGGIGDPRRGPARSGAVDRRGEGVDVAVRFFLLQ